MQHVRQDGSWTGAAQRMHGAFVDCLRALSVRTWPDGSRCSDSKESESETRFMNPDGELCTTFYAINHTNAS